MSRPVFKTLKAAREAGYRELRADQYGGRQVEIKGHVLAKDPTIAVSRTEWLRRGFEVRPAQLAKAHGVMSGRVGEKQRTWYVYRRNQVSPKKAPRPVRAPVIVPILAAVWAVNRAAKRRRDAASEHYGNGNHGAAGLAKRTKAHFYDLKSQVLEHLFAEGVLAVDGLHRFPGGLYAERLCGERYRFHRPCPKPIPEPTGPVEINGIEAKPKEAREPCLKDAVFTIEQFLAARPKATPYQWPARKRPERGRRWDSHPGDDDDDEF